MSNSLRITGMATGMDTDATVKQMMKPYTARVDKMKQDRQIVAWKQELYRDILADTTNISNTYFDILKPDTNMLSKNNYAGFDVTSTSSVTGQSAGVSATVSVGAVVGNYSVYVEKLATTDMIEGATIAVSVGANTGANVNKYTTKLSELGVADGTLIFDYRDSNGATQIGKSIKVSSTDTVSQLMDKVSQGTSGAVKLNFSELTNKFNIESLETGSSASLTVTDTNSVLTNLKLTGVGATVTQGIDAEFKITPPGGFQSPTIKKTGNTFSIDGVNYTLTKANVVGDVTTSTNINVVGNPQKSYDKIKTFIDKYNELVDKIGQKIDEKKQYKFLPLSDEQKKDMKEDEIKQWESKAKVGLLKGDPNLESMLNSMRSAFFQGVEGSGISLSEIGLSTSSDISKKGKIIIDESKLKAAIQTRGEQVVNLFAKQSTTYSSYDAEAKSEERSIRNKEQGIFQRINDILQDYTKPIGKKGILIQKAGLKGDVKSVLSEDIIKKDEKINEMIKTLAAKENKFYLQFSKLEVAMNKLNSQSNWLTQQLSGGQ
jgi:flagellar hook-associated protein 2